MIAMFRNVVQVKFNSWHYSDANLWASLITEIFDSLETYCAQDKENKNEIDKLSASLQLTSLQKDEAERQKKALQQKVATLKEDQQIKREKLEERSGLKLLKIAVTDPKITEDLFKLNNERAQQPG